jgi:hypothetical protein
MRTATETLSTESRLIEDRFGTGSPAGSTTTSLARPRIVVVHGATSVRFRRGIAALRERTTTGRRPTWGSSHHHTSPRAGRALELMMLRPHLERRQDPPSRQAPRARARRRRRTQHRSRPRDVGRSTLPAPDPEELRPSTSKGCDGLSSRDPRRLSCLLSSAPCHNYATDMPRPSKGSVDLHGPSAEGVRMGVGRRPEVSWGSRSAAGRCSSWRIDVKWSTLRRFLGADLHDPRRRDHAVARAGDHAPAVAPAGGARGGRISVCPSDVKGALHRIGTPPRVPHFITLTDRISLARVLLLELP